MPAAPQEAASPASAPAIESSSSDSSAVGATLSDEAGGESALLNRKMVARAALSLIVTDATQTVADIHALMDDVGGFVSNENLYNDSYGDQTPRLSGNLTLRVPADTLEPTLARLAALAVKVENRTLTREDVTDQYTDLDAQLKNLEATETELRAMLTEVRERPDATPEDILAVHNRLTEVRGEIDQAQGRKNMLENLVSLSTIDVNLAPDRSTLPVVEQGWQPGDVLRDALRALVTTLKGLGSLLIWFLVYLLPIALIVLLPIVLIVALIAWIVRGRRRRAAQKA